MLDESAGLRDSGSGSNWFCSRRSNGFGLVALVFLHQRDVQD